MTRVCLFPSFAPSYHKEILILTEDVLSDLRSDCLPSIKTTSLDLQTGNTNCYPPTSDMPSSLIPANQTLLPNGS